MEELNNTIDYIIETHIKLHGKGIVDYAIVGDIMRKTKYSYNKETIEIAVKSKLDLIKQTI